MSSAKALEAGEGGHAAPAPVVTVRAASDVDSEFVKETAFSTITTSTTALDPYPDPSLPPAPAPATRTPLLTRLRTRWTFLPRRTKLLLLAGSLFLLTLILALAIGLAVAAAHHAHPHSSANLTPSGGTHTGDLTWYDPGLGACGLTNTGADAIVAVSHLVFDAAQVGGNPNANPLCGRKIRIMGGPAGNDKGVDVTVVDRCVGCKEEDLDGTVAVFKQFADVDEGRIVVSWVWLE